MESKLELALRELTKSEDFVTFVQHVFAECAVFSSCVASNPTTMATMAGRQEVALDLLNLLTPNHKDFVVKVLSRGNENENE